MPNRSHATKGVPLEEKLEGTLPAISNSTEHKSISVIKQKKCFTYKFKNAFGSFSTQQEVFEASLQPLIDDVLNGYETCVFAYGQTGTGKTYTMEGNLNNPDEFGVIPRSASAIFDKLRKGKGILSYQVSCSYLEIYNEELSDLLVDSNNGLPSQNKLDVMSSGGKNGGTVVRGLSSKVVSDAKQVLDCMTTAAQARRVGETNMNKQSSRSHCIFTISVEAKQQINSKGDTMECRGKLHLVDLAGSESAKTAELKSSSVRDQATREQERRNINKSLLSLGRAIHGLKEQSKPGKSGAIIPYRDSKLTRILQEALGGRCKTVVIATVSPSIMNLNESLQTLQYATQAMGIQNKPVSTSFMSLTPSKLPRPSDSDAMSGAFPPSDQWHEMGIRMQHMEREVEEARAALARKYLLQQELEENCKLKMKEESFQQVSNDSMQKIQEHLQSTQNTIRSIAHDSSTHLGELLEKSSNDRRDFESQLALLNSLIVDSANSIATVATVQQKNSVITRLSSRTPRL